MKPTGTRRALVTYIETVLGPSSPHEPRVIVNQPLNMVCAYLANALTLGAISASDDVTLRRIDTVLGRRVAIVHILYKVPGGTQISAGVETATGERHDLVAVLAVKAARRQLAADLTRLKDQLE